MSSDTITNFENFKKAINILTENKIDYFLFGGYALDVIRDEITRDHGDLDIYVLEDDIQNFLESFGSLGYEIEKKESMYLLHSPELEIGIVVLSEEENTMTAHGNKTLAIYPKEMFSVVNSSVLKEVEVRLVPNEVLALEAQFSRHEKDVEFGKTLDVRVELMNKIKTVKIRDSRNH